MVLALLLVVVVVVVVGVSCELLVGLLSSEESSDARPPEVWSCR